MSTDKLVAADSMPAAYGPILVLILVAILLSAAMVVISHILPKAKRTGPAKDATYEAGMEAMGDARRRFNVRFYLVAMLFLLFDVEIVFMYPWAIAFMDARQAGQVAQVSFLFVEMAIFFGLLLVGFAYDWGKGILRYD
ncbi:MAG TPA: NADH-quinone oxidoreductase subunit A [Phycisphaerae bacterium]|nr:NADH-quinone oxidoreductase subunit A [Phycisphaerae bacterium]